MPSTHYRISSAWLLGFIEGDGSFFFSKNNILAISQKGNEGLFKAICDYFEELAPKTYQSKREPYT